MDRVVTPNYPYQTREVRDLAWACFSPSLLLTRELAGEGQAVSNCALGPSPARLAWLEHLDRDASRLLEHLSRQRSHRLGVYFEHLWHFFLGEDPAVELVAHNLPIHHQGRTLGEFDCIYYCHQRQCHVHLELAVKYFLGHRQAGCTGTSGHWREWLGPNSSDRLDLKIEHLMQRQIRLGDNPVARERLQELGIRELAREVEIKGYLFQSFIDPLPPPPGFNPERVLQTWLTIEQLPQLLARWDDSAYLRLPKAHWLAGAQPGTTEITFDANGITELLAEHIARDPRPQLVAALDKMGRESHRFFVTGHQWPSPYFEGPADTAPASGLTNN